MDTTEQLLMDRSSVHVQSRLIREEQDASPSNLSAGLDRFAEFPYKRPPYSARNWGHPLHSLCSYASKMKPAIAHMLVSNFTSPGAVVLDPFSGSGTIPFEACQQGRTGVAVDLSPLAFCISAGKVNPPSPEEAARFLNSLDDFLHRSAAITTITTEPELSDFYHPETFTEILRAKLFFEERESQGDLGSAHWFVKACLLHILHGNRPYALSRRSHGIIPIPPKGPVVYKSLMASLRDKVHRTNLQSLSQCFTPGVAHLASAMAAPLETGSVDAIITSPPFLGTTEFLRQNRVRLWFSGWSYAQQAEKKATGSFLEYHKTLEIYSDVLTEFRRVIRPTGLLVLHLGVVKKLDMGRTIESVAPNHGFEPIRLLYEDTTSLESHGRTDRGATHQHQFLFLRPIN